MKTFQLLILALFLFVINGFAQRLDTSFAEKGFIKISGTLNSEFTAVSTLANGKFVTTWLKELANSFHEEAFIGIFLENGKPDPAFGTNGKTSLGKGHFESHKLIVQPDGKFLILNYETTVDNGSRLTRVNPNGTIDVTFGSAGVVDAPYAKAIALQSDGKIIVIKNIQNYPDKETIIERLHNDGSQDKTFGSDGSVRVENNLYRVVAIDSKDRILCGGTYTKQNNPYHYYRIITCHVPDGEIDSSFADNGSFYPPDEYITSFHLKIDSLDNMIWGGNGYKIAYLLKLKPNGDRDSSFGANGAAKYNTKNYSDLIAAVEIAENGNIMLLFDRFLCDFLPNGKINRRFGRNGEFDLAKNNMGTAISFQGSNLLVAGKIRKLPDEKGIFTRLLITDPPEITGPDNVIVIENSPNITVFPNPANSVITVSGLDASGTALIKIVSYEGSIVSSTTAEKTDVKEIDVSKLKRGIYFIQIMQNNKVNTLKFIKQ